METRLPVIADVEGLGKIVETATDFYTELQQLEASRASPISPRNEVYARLKTRGKENIGRTYGTRTSAGFEYAKYRLPILRLESRLLNHQLAKSAVEANRQGVYFGTHSSREHEESLRQAQEDLSKEPKKRNVIILPSRDNFRMDDKDNWEIYEAIFKDQAKPYFELNGPIDICLVHPGIVDSQDGTLLTQMWFRDLDDRSGLVGWGLHVGDNRLRGVLKSGEADALRKTERGEMK